MATLEEALGIGNTKELRPYQRVLTREQARKADALKTSLRRLDGRLKLWVRKTNDQEEIDDGVRWPYTINVTLETSTDEIMDMVTRYEKKHGFDKVESEETKDEGSAPLSVAEQRRRIAEQKKIQAGTVLVFAGEVIRKGDRLADYNVIQESKRWSKPYAGVLWLCPAHLAPGFVRSSKWKKDRRDIA